MDTVSLVRDPELGCTAFTVERITCTRGRGGTVSRSRKEQARGCIHPCMPEKLRLLPEEEQAEESIAVYTDYPLGTGTPETPGALSFTAPDRIHWNGRTWRVVRVRDRQAFGYVLAYAVLMHE